MCHSLLMKYRERKTMGKKLVLAEKPSVAKDLATILKADKKTKHYYEGKDYIVTWALGHLLTLKMPEEMKKEWKTWDLKTLPLLPTQWPVKVLPKTAPQLKSIQSLSKRKDIIGGIIATDAGREGELVAREIFQWIRFSKPIERLWISSQTKKAILTGFKRLQPAKKYDHLYYSALARAKADWLVGLNVTRALTTKYEDNLSAGRVQTPTLAAVFEKERKHTQFIPKEYYVINWNYQGKDYPLNETFVDQKQAQQKLEKMKSLVGKVKDIKEKKKIERAPFPYDLTELQRVANQMYHFSAKKTLSLVQSLYETHKIVSYPRTDSKYLPQDIKQTMTERLQALVYFDEESKEYLKQGAVVVRKEVFNDQKVTDHYALIPTEERPRVEKLSSDELKVYRLIVTRFLGLFAKEYVELNQTVTVTFNEKEHVQLQGNKVLTLGFKKEQREHVLHVKPKETLKGTFFIQKLWTTAPSLETEANLLLYMEKNNLGTPATRAEIIEKLLKTELMTRTGHALTTTPKGKQLIELVHPSLITPKLTSKWENQLKQIEKGKEKEHHFIEEIKKDTTTLVQDIKQSDKTYKDFSLTKKVCPECGAYLKEKNTRDGKIYTCSNKTCTYHRRKDPKLSNHRCPVCHRKMEILEGKKGNYFRCKYDGTTEKIEHNKRSKKMNKHEEKRLLKKINQESEPIESPLAQALKAAMKQN